MLQKPNLFIIGAPKCGTTSISSYLKTHPSIFVPQVKEPHYFADDFNEFRTFDDLDKYLKLYERVENQKYLCDASVWYLYSQNAIKNIHQFNPDARIIVIIRNPIEMLPSLHQQLYYTLDEDVHDFKQAWNLQEQRRNGKYLPEKCREPRFLQYLDVANYTPQLERLYNHFPRKQIHLIVFNDFKNDPAKVYQEILNFLNLENDGRNNFPTVNSRKTFRIKFLSEIVHRPPKIFKIASNFIKKILGVNQLNIFKKIKYFNEKPISKNQWDKDFKNEVYQKLNPTIKKLETLTGIELTDWHMLD